MNEAQYFRETFIDPTLMGLGMYSRAASNLMIGTAVQESRLSFLRQLGDGPALGLYQVEPETFKDIHLNYLSFRHEIFERVDRFRGDMNTEFALVFNFPYSTAIARLVYYRNPMPLPEADDIDGLAHMWKEVYNTHLGKGTEEEFVKNYKYYIQ